MKRILILFMAFISLTSVFAQSTEEQKKRIANIKRSSDYIYAEVTTTNRQQAIDLATDMLHNNINEWVAKKKKFAGASKVITRNKNYSIEQITMPRANMYRAFMYVKKSDIIPADNAEVTAKIESSSPIAQKTRATPKPATVETIETNRDKVVKNLLAVTNTGQLSEKLKELKKNKLITEYNNLRGLNGKDLSEYIMVVFNKDGVIEAVLSEGTNKTNLKTRALDLLTNYKGRGAIGVKVNR